MPTLVDQLVVKLGLDNKEFKRGMKESDASVKDVSKSISGFLALLGGGAAFKAFVTNTTQANSALYRLSQNLGQSVSTLSAWGNAAEIAGGSSAGLQSTMRMLSRSQTELEITGNTGIIPYLSMLGVSFNAAGDSASMLLDISSKLEGMDRRRAANILESMGIDEGTANLLLKGRKEVEAMIRAQKEHGAMSKKQAEQSEKLRQQWVVMNKQWETFGRSIMETLTPALEWFAKALEKVSAWVSEHQYFVLGFFGSLAAVLVTLQAAALLPYAPIIALAGALAALYEDYKVFSEGGDSAIPWASWIPYLEKAKDLLIDIADVGFKAAAMAAWVWHKAHGQDKAAAEDERRFERGIRGDFEDAKNAEEGKRAQVLHNQIMAGGQVGGGGLGNSPIAALIRQNESGGNYGAVNLGQAGGYKASTRDLGNMTINDVLAAQGRKEFNAAGAYQVIPDTLKMAMGGLGLKGTEKFDKATQDQIFGWLMMNKVKGAGEFLKGGNNSGAAINGIASEWAAMQGVSGAGMYDQKGVNMARVSPADTLNALLASRPYAGRFATGATNQAGGARTVNNTFGDITINTAATDAAGIATDLTRAMDYSLASQSVGGMH